MELTAKSYVNFMNFVIANDLQRPDVQPAGEYQMKSAHTQAFSYGILFNGVFTHREIAT